MVIPRKKPLRNFDCPSNVIAVYKSKSKTFDSNVMIESFADRVLLPHLRSRNQRAALIYLDNASCHRNLKVLNHFRDNKVKIKYIPPRMTSFLQPADVMWMKFIKRRYTEYWTNWWMHDPKAFTKSHNVKSPGNNPFKTIKIKKYINILLYFLNRICTSYQLDFEDMARSTSGNNS